MTHPIWTDAPDDPASVAGDRASRTRFWRLTLGLLGLFWVGVALWLFEALNP